VEKSADGAFKACATKIVNVVGLQDIPCHYIVG